MGKMIEFARPDGQMAPGYFVEPEKHPESAPCVLVIEEWWGVTAEIMGVADRYASLGFRALVPDLFRGRTAATGDEANHLEEGLDYRDALTQDIAGALRYLKDKNPEIGITGYCMGGGLALRAAMHLAEPKAAVVFYGLPPPEAGDPATIEIPLQCHYARNDEFFTAAAVSKMEERLKFGKVPYELYWYDAKHAFCNPNPAGNAGLGNYDSAAAHTAWERASKFFTEILFQH